MTGQQELNAALAQRMTDLGLTQQGLADQVNAELRAAGRRDTVGDRTVRHWLSGKTRCPQPAQLAALAAVCGCPADALGFRLKNHPAHAAVPTAPAEVEPVHRRSFLHVVTSAALSPAVAAPSRIGMSDVRRLQRQFAQIVADDHAHGGRTSTEYHALALAEEAIELQAQGGATQRVRAALYGTAAAFVSSAMWAAIDSRRFDTAAGHRDRAAALAAMSGDQGIQFRVWSHAGSLYRLMGRPADALAANDVARALPIARRDPLFASLGHARHAAILGLTRDRPAVDRALGRAQAALGRADPEQQRPLWLTAFYDQAELDSLALTSYLAARRYEEAEARAHRSLAARRGHLRRSNVITNARLARAQLGQGDADAAVHTAVALLRGEGARHPRVVRALGHLTETLHATAPGSAAERAWEDHWIAAQRGSA
ncbi:XRE family transcriptional regulator [Streptacidiphilus pinicola]|uniref:XRE family transcriptional regulator n=1 Tax=Streptacidiphilus pinicola TaxID=2219663 RepID=A0A2X0IM87_9ACTN|nr:XRE family transcriptional regulator [Streptacidiphilus pinicola]RAG86234.1 XRE family transcriptional regulator [Streptacidiphilus pinicola]